MFLAQNFSETARAGRTQDNAKDQNGVEARYWNLILQKHII